VKEYLYITKIDDNHVRPKIKIAVVPVTCWLRPKIKIAVVPVTCWLKGRVGR
jgi:hypothetical protein